ncbi:DUF6684 family protein [Halobellus ruber]|uniref:Cox cluster protein n=1 Tax=Halobellus ruber TaxID=2761102 RepID=A0A7J9SIU6_9EURY|nr:DUF6684 family protein [Halobellus ruber]MBB6645946.1 cox cluster protein [Halobellus ruber]
MSNEIFDRETQLDLLVNVIPLFILAFFIVGFLVFAPFGIDPLASAIQFGLIAVPFVLLSVLTYFAAVAVAGSENDGPVYLPGQASVSGAEPLEVPDDEGTEAVPEDAAAAAELDEPAEPEDVAAESDDDAESAADDAADEPADATADSDSADGDEQPS